MTRIVLIYNPASGRASGRSRAAALDVFARAGWTVDIAATEHAGHAVQLARRAATGGVDGVVVNGGDGTIAQAVEGLADAPVPLGILPGGTGNQLARNLRIPGSTAAAAAVIVRGKVRRIDVGVWQARESAAHFTVACGAGFDAEVMRATTAERKRRRRTVAYFAAAVSLARRLVPAAFRITVDGVVTEMEAATVLVANCPRILPPYRPLRAGVRLDDGVLDVVALRATGFREALSVWAKLARGASDPDRIGHLRGQEISIESEPTVPAECDGDVTGTTPFQARVVPGGLEVFVPE